MEEEQIHLPRPADRHPWYAVRTFNCQEQKVSRYLASRDCPHFIPMTLSCPYPVREEDDEPQEEAKKAKRRLVPAVHNLLFVQKKDTQRRMLQLFRECEVPISVFRHPGVQCLCEISDRDMIELRMLCDPDFKTSVFMSQGEAEAMVGKDVRVVAGPFKGAVGRLVRKNKQFYFLKTVIGMGVMVRISRWYCEPV